MTCPSCRLTTFVVMPHAARPQCPHCDADLLPAVPQPAPVRAADPPRPGADAA